MRCWLSLGVLYAAIFLLYCANENGDPSLKLELGGESDESLANNIKLLAKGAALGDDEGSGDRNVTDGSGETSGDGDKRVDDIDDTEISGDMSGDGTTDEEGSGPDEGSTPDVVTVSPTKLSTLKTTKPSTKDTTVEDINTAGATSASSTKLSSTRQPSSQKSDSSLTPNNEIPTFDVSTSKNDVAEFADAMAIKTPKKPFGANSAQQKAPNNSKHGKINFTIGIAIGIAVGAILAVAIILFLVYRIRKKDSGSYMLDEQSSQQSMLRNEETKGKEYFA